MGVEGGFNGVKWVSAYSSDDLVYTAYCELTVSNVVWIAM